MRSGILTQFRSWSFYVRAQRLWSDRHKSPPATFSSRPAEIRDRREQRGGVAKQDGWDPAEHLAADWRQVSVSMTSQRLQPCVRARHGEPRGPQWSMSVTSSLDIIDRTGRGLIGWSTEPTVCEGPSIRTATWFPAWNRAVRSCDGTSSRESWSMAAIAAPLMDSGYSVRMSFPMDPNVDYPAMFSRVEWSMNVLVAQETKTVDIQFEPNDTWVEITPGFEVIVEQATVEEGKYQYRIKVQYDSTQVDYMMGGSIHLWRDETLPSAAVLGMAILNAEGKSVRDVERRQRRLQQRFRRQWVEYPDDRDDERQRQLDAGPCSTPRPSG